MTNLEIERLERTTFHAAEAAIFARNAVDLAAFKLETAPAGPSTETMIARAAVHAQIATAARDIAENALASLHHTTLDRDILADARDATDTAEANAATARTAAARAIVEYS